MTSKKINFLGTRKRFFNDLRTESRIKELKKELYETLEERIEETKETIKVYFREEVKELNKLRSSVIAVEEYIKKTPNTIFELREQVFLN